MWEMMERMTPVARRRGFCLEETARQGEEDDRPGFASSTTSQCLKKKLSLVHRVQHILDVVQELVARTETTSLASSQGHFIFVRKSAQDEDAPSGLSLEKENTLLHP